MAMREDMFLWTVSVHNVATIHRSVSGMIALLLQAVPGAAGAGGGSERAPPFAHKLSH